MLLCSSSLNPPLFRKPNTILSRKVKVTNSNVVCDGGGGGKGMLLLGSEVGEKVKKLGSEFTSLSEPIDRVKRLLHYASLLPAFGESERVPANRVGGCASEVWVVAEMDERRRMRFRADSDSEISKGFCWCLVWMMDGAKPEEVLMVHKDDLANINVGLGMSLKAHSRTNTWHNVFFSMQTAAAKALL